MYGRKQMPLKSPKTHIDMAMFCSIPKPTAVEDPWSLNKLQRWCSWLIGVGENMGCCRQEVLETLPSYRKDLICFSPVRFLRYIMSGSSGQFMSGEHPKWVTLASNVKIPQPHPTQKGRHWLACSPLKLQSFPVHRKVRGGAGEFLAAREPEIHPMGRKG